MINMVMIVGRVISPVEQINLGGNKIGCKIKVLVNNPDKTTTEIESILQGNISQNAIEYLKEGDVIGIRGRLDTNNLDGKEKLNLMANSITFLSSKNIVKNNKERCEER